MKKLLSTLFVGVISGISLQALPTLQVDISNGVYVNETVYATDATFDVVAYLQNKQGNSSIYNLANTTFYLVMAVVPSVTSPTSPDLGSFTINGNQIDVTGEMVYGTPPTFDANPELAPHGVYTTYYYELNFMFNPDNEAEVKDTADIVGVDPVDATGTQFYYQTFSLDMSNLADGVGIHFDLYTYGPDDDSREFAPNSHDGEACCGTECCDEPGEGIPDAGASFILLGLALIGVEGLRRRIK